MSPPAATRSVVAGALPSSFHSGSPLLTGSGPARAIAKRGVVADAQQVEDRGRQLLAAARGSRAG